MPYDPEAARQHLLAADPVIGEIVRRVGAYRLEVRGQPYQSLLRAILYQQLAGAAASAIERRFLNLYGGRVPEPEELLATSPEGLRSVGLSRQKASYLRSLAEHAAAGQLELRRLSRASDDKVLEIVTAVKGIGRWTADTLLMFCLGRPDVLPVGDLFIQRMMKEAYRLDSLPDPATMLQIAEPWRPYRSAGTWYLWRHGEVITADVTL
ncbi:MAG: hypothetical protein A2148_04300 [Chloroflexi bacterium RBG_16_68_14]|nr:MAG: hypothetical protein A2148_04300 [Chloroflexi bacterium RBG_16_68_14]